MDPISNIDRVVLLLRQRLQERAKAAASRTAATARRDGEPGAVGLDNVQALAAVEGVDDHQLGRALIQSILVDHFGPETINDAKVQQIIDRVTEALREDAAASRLLARMVDELRASAD